MNTTRVCPICGKPVVPEAPQGLCPECLMKSGFETRAENEAAGGKSAFVPPSVEQMAKLFPQLEIIELLGQGGMGAVYKARQPRLNRFVALKILSPEKQSDPQFAERFEREARALAWLNHPNIVTVYDFGETQGNYFLLMEFVDGQTLRQVLLARRLASAEALAIVPQICQALQYAHDQGVIHRDIKPENILLDKKGQVKIADFGIAKLLDQAPQDISLTGAKDVVGTPYYMAPEQIEKPQTVDHRADIYSLGVVFYEMLTGELPLGNFQPPSQKVPIDVRLDEVVLHAMEKEPERRYQKASQIKMAVETIAGTTAPAGNAEVFAQDSLAGDYTLDIGSCLHRGWALVRGNFWPVMGVTLLILLLRLAAFFAVIGVVVSGPLMGGLSLYFLKKIRGEPAGVGAAFSGFSRAFLPLFLASLVMAVLTTAGFFCLILPGIYLAVAWTFTLALVIDKRLGFWPAMGLSRKTISKHWWKFFGFIIVLSLIKMAGMLVFFVGSLITAPVALAALMYAYEDIFGVARKPAEIPSPVPPVAATAQPARQSNRLWGWLLAGLLILLLIGLGIGLAHRRHLPAGQVFIAVDSGKSFQPGDVEVQLIEKQEVADFLQKKQAVIELGNATLQRELAAATEGVEKAEAALNSFSAESQCLTNADYVTAKTGRDKAKAERDSLIAEYPAFKQRIDSARVKASGLEKKQAKMQTKDAELDSEVTFARIELQDAQNVLADYRKKAALLKDTIALLQDKMDTIERLTTNPNAAKLDAAKTQLAAVKTRLEEYPGAETYLSDFSPVMSQKAHTDPDGKLSFRYPRDKAFTIFATATHPAPAERYYWLVDAPTNGETGRVLLNNNNLVYADPDGYFKVKPKEQLAVQSGADHPGPGRTSKNHQSNRPTPIIAATELVSSNAFGNLLNKDQRLVVQATDRQFRSFLDTRTFNGWSEKERADLERRLIDALKGPRSDEYYQAINSLAALRSINALPALRELAFDRREKDNRDRWMSARALGLLGDRQSVPELIPLLYHYNVNTRWWAQISLVGLTGQNFGKDWRAWGKWWNSQNGQPPFNPEIIRWSKTQAEPDQLAESLEESDRRFLENLK
jgi:tRNA A-37 threonylcarbamoyl transferase component Bud32